MSVRQFKELEEKLFNEKIKTPPDDKIAIEITIKVQQTKKIITIGEVEIKRLLQEIKAEREYNFVCLNSFLYKELCELNKKYTFNKINVPSFDIKCNSYSEYQKFDIRQYVWKRLIMKMDGLAFLYNQICVNQTLYQEYQKCYCKYSKYLRSIDEIKSMKEIPLSAERFQIIEQKIYSQLMLKEPIVDFSVCYKIEYTSPAGRNHYSKKESLTKKMLGDILGDIENEKMELQAFEREMESLRAEEEQKKQELKRQKEIDKQKRAQERAEIRALLKNKGKLEQKEAELAQREQEFQRATQGHIYAVLDGAIPVEVEHPKIETTEELLSAWEKMKWLKKTYENGEITYEEYNEKRKHLL